MKQGARAWLVTVVLIALPTLVHAQSDDDGDDVDAPTPVPSLFPVPTAGDNPLTTPPKIPTKPKPWYEDKKGDNVRRGAYFGAGTGLGMLSGIDGETNPATGLNLRVGLMLNPRLAAGFELFGAAHAKTVTGKLDYGAGSLGVSVVYWVETRWWLSGGAGYAELFRRPSETYPGGKETNGFAFNAALGYELWRASNGKSAFDVHARLFGSTYDDDDDVGGVLVLIGFAAFGVE
jgi:hypothetical protein